MGRSWLSGRELAAKQKSDQQGKDNDANRGGGEQQPARCQRVDAACGVESVAEQVDLIGPAPDAPLTRLDQCEAQARRINREGRESARDPPFRCDDESRRGMGELIMLAIIDCLNPKRIAQGPDIRSGRTQEIAVLGADPPLGLTCSLFIARA